MGRSALASIWLLCLAGCAQSIDDKLLAGDITVCADDEVEQAAVIGLLLPSLANSARRADARIDFEAVTASNINKKLGEVDCDATLNLDLKEGYLRQVAFSYTVRRASNPTTEKFVVSSKPSPQVKAAIQLALEEQFTPTLNDFGP